MLRDSVMVLGFMAEVTMKVRDEVIPASHLHLRELNEIQLVVSAAVTPPFAAMLCSGAKLP